MSMNRWVQVRYLAWLVVLAAATPALTGEDLASRIEAVIHQADYRQAHWGILVVDASTGKEVYSHNPEKLFAPASTTKLYSCAAALVALGPGHRFETPVYRRGSVEQGRLQGDLILVAQGDLTLGGRTDASGKMAFKDHDHTYAGSSSLTAVAEFNAYAGWLLRQPPRAQTELTDTAPLAGLTSLARQVAAAGIRQVAGDVLVDDRLFERSQGSGSGPGLLTPIVVNDNVIDVQVTPGEKPGESAQVKTRPKTSFVQVDARVETVEEWRANHVEVRRASANRVVVRGQVALKARPIVRIFAIEDPAAFARALFIEALEKEGVRVGVSALQPPQAELPPWTSYSRLPRVAVYQSPPFSEVIKVTLKVSHNLYASTLPLLLAVKNGRRTLNDGLRLQQKFLIEQGVDVSTISFAGGAGGMNADAVTPRATVQLLRAMARRPEFPAYRAALPILGVDGTLTEAVGPDSLARGKVQAKTGTLWWYDALNDRHLLRSKALAGVMTTARGRDLCFAIFVNEVPLPPGVTPAREGKVLGRLCEILCEHVP